MSSLYVFQSGSAASHLKRGCKTCFTPTFKFAPPVGDHPKLAKFCSKECAKVYKLKKKVKYEKSI